MRASLERSKLQQFSTAPHFAPPFGKIAFFPVAFDGCSTPRGVLLFRSCVRRCASLEILSPAGSIATITSREYRSVRAPFVFRSQRCRGRFRWYNRTEVDSYYQVGPRDPHLERLPLTVGVLYFMVAK